MTSPKIIFLFIFIFYLVSKAYGKEEKVNYKELMLKLKNEGIVKTITIVNGKYIGSKALLDNENKIEKIYGNISFSEMEKIAQHFTVEDETSMKIIENESILYEKTLDVPRLILLGGGHVSKEVSLIAKRMGFFLTVVDDRCEFASKERFPEADEVLCCPFEEAFDKIPDTLNSYYVIVTRGHTFDGFCLRKVLERDCKYRGMIGSRSKVRKIMQEVKDEGYDPQRIAETHSPIGIRLGGNLPTEVAVSIAAEIIQIRHKENLTEIDNQIKNYLLTNDRVDGVMVTITERKGSSPRDVGTKMLVFRNGKILGSIGGGALEYNAIQTALKTYQITTEKYSLSKQEGAKLGMICGGRVQVIFEPLD